MPRRRRGQETLPASEAAPTASNDLRRGAASLALRFKFELRIVRRLELLELVEPLRSRLAGREAPVLAMVVPVVGIQLLRALEMFLRQLRLLGVMEPDCEREIRLGVHLVGRSRLDALGEGG